MLPNGLILNSTVVLTCPGVTTGDVGVPFSSPALSVGGGTAPYTFSIVGGLTNLPAGLTLNTSTGAVTGTPTASGTFSVQVTDTNGAVGTACAITINPPLSVTCSATNTGTQGAAFNSGAESVTGGTSPNVFSIVGGLANLPAGLSLNASSGAVTGTPTATGTFSIQVTDAYGLTSTACSITIKPSLAITTTSLPQGSPRMAYNFQPQFVGGIGTLTWAASGLSGSGLNINTSTGLISGTPVSVANYQVTITVSDSTLPTPQSYSTQPLTLTIAISPLTVTTNPSPLANAVINTVYNAQIVVNGGLSPYNISANTTSPSFPAWLTYDPTNLVCGNANTPGTVSICGTPTTANIGTDTFIITVTDSANTVVNQTFSFTVTQPGGVGTITVQNATVGQGLEVPIAITLSPAQSFSPPPNCDTPGTPGCLTITSSNSSVLIGSAGSTGTMQLVSALPAGTTTVSVYVQAVGSPGATATVTVSAPGYISGAGTVTIANSGFVVSGPGGIGANFTTYQGVSTTLTVYAARLDSNGLFVEPEELIGGSTAAVPISFAPATLGSLSPTTLTFSGGTSSVTTTLKATSVTSNFGQASVTLTAPTSSLGFTFGTPLVGESLNVNVLQSGLVAPVLNIGQNLQAFATVGLTGNAPSAQTITLTSNNASLLQFTCVTFNAFCTTGTGNPATSATLTVVISQNQTQSSQFLALAGNANSGTVGYNITSTNYGTLPATVTLVPAELVVQVNSSVILGQTPQVTVLTAALVGSAPVSEAVAVNQTVTATVTSNPTSVGTIPNPTVTISGGSSSGTTTFQSAALGTTTITATATGFSSGSTQVTVSSGATLNIFNGATVGQYLENQNSMILGAGAPAGGLPVTLSVAAGSIGLMQLAVNPTDPGSNNIVVTVPAGQSTATYYVYSLQSAGTATYGASATGYTASTDTLTLAPSGFIIYGTTPSGTQTCAISCNVPLSGGAQTFTVYASQLSTDGNFTLVGTQSLAGPTGAAAATTTGTASNGGTALTVASGTGLAVGQLVFGSGIAPGTFLASGSGTSWVLSKATTNALSSAALSFYNTVLNVTLTDSTNGEFGTLSGPAAVAPGADTGALTFSPTADGSTVLSINQPNGFVSPQGIPGSELASVNVTVGP